MRFVRRRFGASHAARSVVYFGVGLVAMVGLLGCQDEKKGGGGTGGKPAGGGSGGTALLGGSPGADGAVGDSAGALAGSTGQGGGNGNGGALGGGGSQGGGTMDGGGPSSAGGNTASGGSVVGGASGGGARASGGAVGAGGATGGGGSTAGTGGSTSKTCGGQAGVGCQAGEFCDLLPVGNCGRTPGASGVCQADSLICPPIYAPVCGCDGKTYPDECSRKHAKVSKAADGECKPATPCPASIDQVATWVCTEGLICEYGTDPRPNCRPKGTCAGGGWVINRPTCAALPTTTCPTTREAASGQSCAADGAYCTYSGVSCKCTNCPTMGIGICEGPLKWSCVEPNTSPGCPAGQPLLGSACTGSELRCKYLCGPGSSRLCKNGAWIPADGDPCIM